VIYESEEPVDIGSIARKLKSHWFTTYRAVIEIILEDLRQRHPEILEDLRIRPIKTTRGWVFAKPSGRARPEGMKCQPRSQPGISSPP